MRLPRLVGFSLRVVLLSHKTTNAGIGLLYAATPKAADHPERAFHMLLSVFTVKNYNRNRVIRGNEIESERFAFN